MEKKLKLLNSLFGKGMNPDVKLFKERLQEMTPGKQKKMKRVVFQLAFAYWKEIPEKYRVFIQEYIKGNLVEYNQYVLEETPVSKFRIKISSIGWIIFMVKLMVCLQIIPKCSFILLSCNMLLFF